MIQNKTNKQEWFRIRRNLLSKEQYMQADGTWGPWRTAKRFRESDAAIAFAELHTQESVGLFTHEN